MGFSSVDNFISEVGAGKFWRQDFMKLHAPAPAVAGYWWDISQGNGTPAQYLHGNYITNYDFVAGTDPWVFSGAYWSYAAGTHSMSRSANGDGIALSQNTRCVPGQSYMVTVSATVSAGAFTVALGGTNGGTTLTGTAVVRQIIVCGATANAPLTITPNATAACTLMDLVSVQPIVGTFTPYNDLTEGALWHGGNVSPDTKHPVNWGAWANFATGLPIVLMLVDVLGVYTRVSTTTTIKQILSATDIAGGGARILTGTTLFDEEATANVTNTLVTKATESIPGGSANLTCNKFAITDAFTTGKFCCKVTSAALNPELASYPKAKYVYFWIRSSHALDAGDISFCTDETAKLASSQDVLLPAVPADTWTRVRLDVSQVATTDRDTVISIGLKAVVDQNLSYSLYVDDFVYTLPDGVIANGNFVGAATYWTCGTANWAYGSGDVVRTANADVSTLSQGNLPIVAKCPYQVQYTIAGRNAGGVTVSLGGTAGTQRTANGTWTQTIIPGVGDNTIVFTPDATFDGHISHVIVFAKFPRCDEGLATFGDGVRMFYVLDNALTNGTGANNTLIKYTNSGAAIGTSNKDLGGTVGNLVSTTQGHLPHSGPAVLKYGPFLPMAPGDHGIQSVESMQFTGAGNQADGAHNLLVCKPIASIPITTAYVAAERDLMSQLPSLPRIRDGAYLMFITFNGGATAAASQFQGYMDFAWS
jgi:hypothetical protein